MTNEAGIGIISPLFFVGVVENNMDPRLEGRVQVRAFNIHGTPDEIPTDFLPWAIPIVGTYDNQIVVPAVNAWVFGFFIDGRAAQQPMLLGLVPTQMTEFSDPASQGWGAAPPEGNASTQGSRPEDIGQPTMPRSARGEDLTQTHLIGMEGNRVTDVPSPAGLTNVKWEEPPPAYDAKYPFNRVLETSAGHVIEYDDTPGAERILMYHTSGAYVQMDSGGSMVNKAVGDKYDIAEGNLHIYTGGMANITVMGDANLYVGGSLNTEVMGDYNLTVHGDMNTNVSGNKITVAGDSHVTKSSLVFMESTADDISLKSAQTIGIEAGLHATIKAVEVKVGGDAKLDLSTADLKISSSGPVSVGAGGAMMLDPSGKLFLRNGDSSAADPAPTVATMETPAPTSKANESAYAGNPHNQGGSKYGFNRMMQDDTDADANGGVTDA